MKLRYRDKTRVQACEWLIRVRDMGHDARDPIPEPEARFGAFVSWISQSPDHADAGRGVVETSRRLRQINCLRAIDVEMLLDQLHGRPTTRVPCSPRRPWSVLATLLILLVVPLLFETGEASPISYQASVGERLFVSLEDKSTVELNTRTHIRVQYGPHSRDVALLSGEAIFDVRHDPSRPFRVISGDTVIEDVSTKFVVYRHPDDTTTITVIVGRVVVSSAAGRRYLDVGQTITAGGGSEKPVFGPVSLSPREIMRRLSWQEGLLSFQGETLAEAISEVNRYNRRQLVIEDPAIAEWQVGGTFQAHNLDAFVATLETLFDLRADPRPNDPRFIELRHR
jgi:transmembrane sensor